MHDLKGPHEPRRQCPRGLLESEVSQQDPLSRYVGATDLWRLAQRCDCREERVTEACTLEALVRPLHLAIELRVIA